MTRLFSTLSMLFLLGLLAACGFHLRGLADGTQRQFPFSRLYIDVGAGSRLAAPLLLAMKSYPNIQVMDQAATADGVLRILSEKTNKDLSSIDRSGQASEYRLSYVVTAQVWINGRQIGPDIVLNQSRTMTYTDSAVLGKDQEETLLWGDMARNVAQLMVYRLSNTRLLREAASEAAAVAPAARASDAVTQH
ncbi:LPS assembly lipoprotein LptE [Paludibacterium sp. B53371]|uniref:LPS-assembly lipoprotein LptE n=1 Tax=Paludibacterium sp. B53371 TaxID=2806263 RepID=UPI001C03D600|nr:LPS assembly lipoprotein LptE [Paludibacterium sp. B53371]